jgi:hypothetical protein
MSALLLPSSQLFSLAFSLSGNRLKQSAPLEGCISIRELLIFWSFRGIGKLRKVWDWVGNGKLGLVRNGIHDEVDVMPRDRVP